MENNTPQGQPRRQPTYAGPKVAVAQVDPCIVYLEAIEFDEVTSLFACWARSSNEVREVGIKPHLKLNQVLVLKGNSFRNQEGCAKQDGKTRWHFVVHEEQELAVKTDADRDQIGLSLSIHFPSKSVRGLRGQIKFIDKETDLSLERLVFGKAHSDPAFVKKILEISSVEWPSLRSALTFLQQKQPTEVDVHSDKILRRLQAEASRCAQTNEDEPQYNHGETLFKMGQYKRALQELQLALKRPGVRYQALNLMGLSFMKLGMLDLAVKRFAEAASELPAMDELKKEIVYNLGLAYEASNRPDKSLKQWKKIYEVDMDYRDVSKRVEEAYGDNDEQAA